MGSLADLLGKIPRSLAGLLGLGSEPTGPVGRLGKQCVLIAVTFCELLLNLDPRMLRDYFDLPLSVRILCVGSLINRAGSFVVIFLTIYASEQLNFGVSFATACVGVLGLGAMVGSIVGGHLADLIGRRTVMLIALLGGALMLLIVGWQTNRWAFMLAVGAFSSLAEMYRPAASAMIADVVTVKQRAHAFALMYIAINLGFAIAPTLGGALASYSFQLLFVGDAVTMSAYGVIVLLMIKEALPSETLPSETLPSETGKRSTAKPGVANGRSEQRGGGRRVTLREAVRHAVVDLPFMGFCFATLLISLVFMQCMSTLPIYIRSCGYSNLEFGLLMSINGILIFILQLPVTQYLSRFNAMSTVLAGGILIAIGFGITGAGVGIAFLTLTICIWTVGEILQSPFKHAIVTQLAPINLRGRYLGIYSMSYALALTIGAPAGGEILTRLGSGKLWLISAFVSALAVLVYALIHRSVTVRVATAMADEA
ncbi:MDR family MFS transporter [Planctomycetes bacterium K23_9]|uniref:Multidrug resistance protein MdtH n=1 Tax=Stieleria marina TaxID=1930275 RepID=A0A517NS13_9BACT|nr:Multidrug resistance protein MdtH [Planctomycetes bacterium K23_9]